MDKLLDTAWEQLIEGLPNREAWTQEELKPLKAAFVAGCYLGLNSSLGLVQMLPANMVEPAIIKMRKQVLDYIRERVTEKQETQHAE